MALVFGDDQAVATRGGAKEGAVSSDSTLKSDELTVSDV